MATFNKWQTPFYVGEVKDHDKVVDAFMPFILKEKEYFHSPWTLANCLSSCHHDKNSVMPWDVWWDAVTPNFSEYLNSLEPVSDYEIKLLDSWCNIYKEGGYQEIHDHSAPKNNFSCSYFFEYPDDTVTGGELILENTKFTDITATGLENMFKSFNQKCFIPNVKSGVIVIFPSWIKHFTSPNKSKKRRTTFSANVTIEPRFTPEQMQKFPTEGSVGDFNFNYLGEHDAN